MAQHHYGMVVDVDRCIGCSTCSVACKVENNLPNDVWWNRILIDGGEGVDFDGANRGMDVFGGQWPNPTVKFVPVNCQHCENPACAQVCPTGATHVDEETGAVLVDYDQCIGCQSCIEACPYPGVRTYIAEEPTWSIDVAVGDAEAPKHMKGVVEKCTMCSHRLAQGLEPACVEVCPARARFWGDLNDPDSDVSKLVSERNASMLNAEAGTEPFNRYLDLV